MKLPESFELRMKDMLGASYHDFSASYDSPYHVALKVNTLKIDVASFLEKFPYELTPVPWTTDGFYYHPEAPVTKHPYFHAGLYYIQEPSAMSPVQALGAKEGDRCLDLCAAPGGKSMQIATAIKDKGLLVTNDINETRVKAILRNVEKFGLRNVIVLDDSPQKIAKIMGHRFDCILVDAPCSGEGMFRKDPKAVKSWETYGPEACSNLQREITSTLEGLITHETNIVYSTCTFSHIENEDQIDYLIDAYTCFQPRALSLNGIEPVDAEKSHMAHIWPHRHRGEGHFIAGLVGKHASEESIEYYEPNIPPPEVVAFMENHMKIPLQGYFVTEKERVYLKPEIKFPTRGLKIVREGLLIGEIKKGRFTPSQALAMYLKVDDFHPIVELDSNSLDAIKYLKCEILHVNCETEGLHLVCTDGYPLGFAKINGGTLKNQYPTSWRML